MMTGRVMRRMLALLTDYEQQMTGMGVGERRLDLMSDSFYDC